MNDEELFEKLSAYMDGELSGGELQQLRQYLSEHPDAERLLRQLRQDESLLREHLRRYQRAIDPLNLTAEAAEAHAQRRELLGGRPAARVFTLRRGLAVAAVVLLAAGIWALLPPGRIVGPGPAAIAGETQVVPKDIEVTVFNKNLALIKDHRLVLNLAKGDNTVRFSDVAERILPDSVKFVSRTDPAGTTVVEQNYQFDLASASAILKKYIDKSITCIYRDGATVEGKLLSFQLGGTEPVDLPELRYRDIQAPLEELALLRQRYGVQQALPMRLSKPHLTLQTAPAKTEIVPLARLDSISVAKLPEGLIARPTLVWKLRAATAGKHDTLLSYLTEGMSWRVDYVLVVGKDNVLNLTGWVTINNDSGTTYKDAKLKLIAGDVHRVREQPQVFLDTAAEALKQGAQAVGGRGFEEKAFFEYHLYTLGRRTTLQNKQIKQIELFEPGVGVAVKAKRSYEYDGQKFGEKVVWTLEFKNDKQHNLGIPLPAGKIRIFSPDVDGQLEFLGTETIDHTPKDEDVTVKMGYVFDIVGERKVVDIRRPARRVMEQDIQITLRNHKNRPVQVKVVEHLLGYHNWRIFNASGEYKKKDFQTVEFVLSLPANGERVFSYTVRYTW